MLANVRHHPFRTTLVLIATLIGLVTGAYIWALKATDTSQLARALVWGDSGFGDQELFPARRISAGSEKVIFEEATGSQVGNFEYGGVGIGELAEANQTTALIVLHGDVLLYEQYFNGSSHDSVQTSFSVAKSFTATLLGIALEEGLVRGLGDSVTDYVPELAQRDPAFTEITLLHLLTMSSGLSFDHGSSPWADPANTYYGTDLRSSLLDTPYPEGLPGAVFDYNDWNVILLGMVLERATGMSVAEYTESRLWQPMGAEADGSWSLDSTQHGFEKMFVGVNGRAIDFAKLGWLYLHDGRNGSKQVIPEAFIAEATSNNITTDPAPEYQYLWWIDENRDAYYANGDHGQFIYVDRAAQLVIVRHGRSPGDVDWVQLMGDMARWLAPQLTSSP